MRQSDYVIDGGQPGKERLALLSDVFRPTTRRLLERAGLSPGMRCLDVGCGGGDLTLHLAQRVGPTGEVVGVDFDAGIIALAREDAARRGTANIAFVAADAGDITRLGTFDVAYARFLLTHVSDPDRVLGAMAGVVRPGGSVVVEDIDFDGHFSHPDCPALRRYMALYGEASRRLGGDPHIGRRLPAMFRAAGLARPNTRVIQLAHERGNGKRLTLITMRRIAPAVERAGLATAEEIRQVIAELDAFTSRPDTIIGLPRIFQVWAARPG